MGEDIDARRDCRQGGQVDDQGKDESVLAGVQGENIGAGGDTLGIDDFLDLVEDSLLGLLGNLRFLQQKLGVRTLYPGLWFWNFLRCYGQGTSPSSCSRRLAVCPGFPVLSNITYRHTAA